MLYDAQIGSFAPPVGDEREPSRRVTKSAPRAAPGVTSGARAIVTGPRVSSPLVSRTSGPRITNRAAVVAGNRQGPPITVPAQSAAPSSSSSASEYYAPPATSGPYYAPSAGSAGPSAEPSSALAKPDAPNLEQTPVSASVDVPWELWAGLGLLAAGTVVAVVYVATRHAPKPRKRRPFSVAP